MSAFSNSDTEKKPILTGWADQRFERQAVLGLFVSGVLHEIANPFNAILMNAELGLLYLENDGEREKLAEVLRTVAREAKRGGALGQDLLRFAQADDYTPRMRGNLNDVITQAGKLLGSKAKRDGVDLVLRKTNTLPQLMINPMALALVLASFVDLLISVGAKRIEISAIRDGGGVVLDLNTGAPALAVVNSDSYPELLLSFARRVMQAHAGALSTDNGVFRLHFPLDTETS